MSCAFITNKSLCSDRGCLIDIPALGSPPFLPEDTVVRAGTSCQRLHRHDLLPLHRAISLGNVEQIAMLCELNISVNERDPVELLTPMNYAVRCFLKKPNLVAPIVKILLSHPCIQPDIPDKDNKTPLMYACLRENVVLARELLLSNKVNINAVGGLYNETVLFMVVHEYFGNRSILDLLLKRIDLDVNLGNCFGETPLYKAITKGDTQTACSLIAHPNTYINLKIDGKTFLDLAYLLEDHVAVKCIFDSYEQSKRAAFVVLMAGHPRAGAKSPARFFPVKFLKNTAFFVLRSKPVAPRVQKKHDILSRFCCSQ